MCEFYLFLYLIFSKCETLGPTFYKPSMVLLIIKEPIQTSAKIYKISTCTNNLSLFLFINESDLKNEMSSYLCRWMKTDMCHCIQLTLATGFSVYVQSKIQVSISDFTEVVCWSRPSTLLLLLSGTINQRHGDMTLKECWIEKCVCSSKGMQFLCSADHWNYSDFN